MYKIKYKNADMFYKTYGKPENPALVLLHGYLESMEVWKDFAGRLMDDLFLIIPDLPGHGSSGVFDDIHTMEELAEAVENIVEHLKLEKIHLAGHSMGGYVTLAFRELFPDRLKSYILFHSHCFADPDDRKQNRDKEIELIQSNKKDLIINTNIPRLFANEFKENFQDEINLVKKIAMATPDNGVIAMLRGMKIRSDRSHLLAKNDLPLLLITGAYDILIPEEDARKMLALSPKIKRGELLNSGHMGFIEEPENAAKVLKNFILSFETT